MTAETPAIIGNEQLPDTKMYTRDEAVKLGRRSICETSEGHRIELMASARCSDGSRAWSQYACTVCDVIVTLEYPPLGR